jgi:hypothetical protein
MRSVQQQSRIRCAPRAVPPPPLRAALAESLHDAAFGGGRFGSPPCLLELLPRPPKASNATSRSCWLHRICALRVQARHRLKQPQFSFEEHSDKSLLLKLMSQGMSAPKSGYPALKCIACLIALDCGLTLPSRGRSPAYGLQAPLMSNVRALAR